MNKELQTRALTLSEKRSLQTLSPAGRKSAYRKLMEGSNLQDALKSIEEIEAEEKEKEIKRQELLRIKEVFNIKLNQLLHNRNKGIIPAIGEFEEALNTKLSEDLIIWEKQVRVVLSTYEATEDKDVANKMKETCYKFIDETFSILKRVNLGLIEFMFWGDWISDHTTCLLKKHYDIINGSCMNIVIVTRLQAILRGRKNFPNYEHPFSKEEEKNLKELIALYQK